MPTRRATIARVALARSLPRLLALPALLLGLAGVAAAAGLLLVPGSPGIALVVVAVLLALAAVAMAAVLLSVRLDIEESAVRVSWIGGGRVYVLSPGPVTRVRLRGPNASRIRLPSGAVGWGLGRAVLRGEERIHIVRLARTATAILVPTDRGRLAIAPAKDDDLLDALSRAARARQRSASDVAAAAVAPSEPEAPADVEAREVAEPTTELTGIERALLEERLAAERAAAERAAAERWAADLAAAAAAAEQHAEPISDVSAPVAEPEPAVAAAPEAEPQAPTGLRRFGARAAFVVLPLLGAGVAWFGGLATGRMPDAGTDLARLTSLALVMAGPATSVAAVMALAWWPRLVGVVVTGGLVASVFIGRALIAA